MRCGDVVASSMRGVYVHSDTLTCRCMYLLLCHTGTDVLLPALSLSLSLSLSHSLKQVHPLLRTIHDLLLVELAGWPRPRVIRKSLKLIWKGREQAEKEASAEDDDLHSAKKFPREALVFVKCQLAILRCPVTSLQASRDRKSSSYSSSRTLLFVFAWLLVKLDFFRKSSTLWAESSSSSSASSCAFSKSIVESPSGCDTTTTTDFHRIARCKDPLYNNEAHNAAAVGIREAQRVVSKLWACPQDKQGAQGINDQVNRTATLNGKLWKCVSSIASLQSCRYRMLHDMSDTIKDITRERMNDLKNRHKHGYESDVKTIPHDDPSLDAYQLHLIRDPIQMVRTLPPQRISTNSYIHMHKHLR